MDFKYILLIFLLLAGCKPTKNKNENSNSTKNTLSLTIDGNTSHKIVFHTLIDSIKFLPISNKEVIGNVDGMISNNDSLFLITDKKYTNSLYMVNAQGEIVGSYKYIGKGPQEGLYLYDIGYDSLNNRFECLLRNPSKILMFNNRLDVTNVISLEHEAFRFIRDSTTILLYCHDEDNNICQIDFSNKRNINTFNLSSIYYQFSPTPVFFRPNESNVYFNIPKDPILYKVNNGQFEEFLQLKVINGHDSNQKSKKKLKIYPPTIQCIFETADNLIILYRYKYLVRTAILSKNNNKVNQGLLLDKLGLKGNFHQPKKGREIYGSMTADKFIRLVNNYRDLENQNEYPKLILPENYQDITINDNPLIVKYYFKN